MKTKRLFNLSGPCEKREAGVVAMARAKPPNARAACLSYPGVARKILGIFSKENYF